jgi:hypothetical protein
MMAESILRDKSKEFAKQIVFLCRDLLRKPCNFHKVVIKQRLKKSMQFSGRTFYDQIRLAHSQ